MDETRRKSHRRVIYALVIVPLALLAVALTWLIIEVRAVYVAEPVVAVNYSEKFRDHALMVAGVDSRTADRAWALLVEAVATSDQIHREYDRDLDAAHAQPRSDGDGFVADYTYIRDAIELAPDMEQEWEAIRRLRAAGVFDTLARFAELGPGVAPAGRNIEPIMLEVQPILSSSRHIARARVASMRLAHSQGDFAEVARAFDEVLAIGRTMTNGPALIWSMVGASLQSMAMHEARHLLMEGRFDAEVCHTMLRSLERHAPPPPEFGVEAERALMLDLIQWIYSDDGQGDGYLLPSSGIQSLAGSESPNLIMAIRSRFLMHKRRETTEWFQRWFDAHVQPVSAEEYRRISDYIDSGDNLVLSTIAPALDGHLRLNDTLRLDADGLRVMLMLAVHRARHGSYPATLDDLDREFEPPTDPFSNEPLRYRLLDDDAHGRPYLLYSVGYDRRDDGGRDVEPGVNRSHVIYSTRYSGYDYIINPPRRGLVRPDSGGAAHFRR